MKLQNLVFIHCVNKKQINPRISKCLNKFMKDELEDLNTDQTNICSYPYGSWGRGWGPVKLA